MLAGAQLSHQLAVPATVGKSVDEEFDQMWATGCYGVTQGAAERVVVCGFGIAEAEGEGGMLETDLLRRPPALLEFGQAGLRQVIENAAATVVDRNDYGIAPLRKRQSAEIVLAGQVAEQGDDASMHCRQAHSG